MTKPHALLLDEPLSALAQQTRWQIQKELKLIQHKWNLPLIIVTHDRQEALSLGDAVLEINNGCLSTTNVPLLYSSTLSFQDSMFP